MLKSTINLVSRAILAIFITVGFNARAEVTYDYMPLSIMPADGSTVSQLTMLEIATPDAISSWNGYKTAVVKNAQTGTEVTTGTFSRGSAYSDVKCTFASPVTEEGTYIVVIPENSIGDEAW